MSDTTTNAGSSTKLIMIKYLC